VNAGGGLRSTAATAELGYEELPGRVRGRLIASGRDAVRYQLYPAAGRS
jgi:hypothetical protein